MIYKHPYTITAALICGHSKIAEKAFKAPLGVVVSSMILAGLALKTASHAILVKNCMGHSHEGWFLSIVF